MLAIHDTVCILKPLGRNDIRQTTDEMTNSNEFEPGSPAPAAGSYEEISISGAPTGMMVYCSKGALLPLMPRGYMWRFSARPLIADMSAADLLARAVDFHRMATTASTVAARDGLLRVVKRFREAADRAAVAKNETALEVADRHLRQIRERITRQHAAVARLEGEGKIQAAEFARRLLGEMRGYLEAVIDNREQIAAFLSSRSSPKWHGATAGSQAGLHVLQRSERAGLRQATNSPVAR